MPGTEIGLDNANSPSLHPWGEAEAVVRPLPELNWLLQSQSAAVPRKAPRGRLPTFFYPHLSLSKLLISWAYLGLPTVSTSYTTLFNLLNFPVGVVPVTTVTAQDEEEMTFYKGYYRDSYDRSFSEVSFPLLQGLRPGLVLASIPVGG